MLSLFHSSLLDWQVGALTTPVDPWNSARKTWKSEARTHFTSVIVPVVLICQTCPGRLKYRFLDLLPWKIEISLPGSLDPAPQAIRP